MKKTIALIMAALLLAVTMGACSPNAPAEGSAEPTAEESAAADQSGAASGEKLEIVFWHTLTDQHEEALKEIVSGFNASQDRYEVVLEQQPYSEYDAKLLQSVSNGTGPDIVSMYPSDAVNYISDGYLYDMSGFINDPEDGMPDFYTDIPAGVLADVTQWGGDSVYLIPEFLTGEVLFYNKTMFDSLDLTAPKTWTDVENDAKAIYNAYGIPGFGTDSVTDTYQCLISQAGSAYIDTDTKTLAIDRDIGIEKLNWFADGVKAGYFRLVGEDMYFSNPFGSQAVGMYIGASAGVSYVYYAIPEGEGNFELGCCPVPQEGPVPYISNWANGYACLSRDEEHARGVYTFLKYFTSTDICVKWCEALGGVPAYLSALNDEGFKAYAETNIAVKALSDEIAYIGHLPSIYGSATVRTEIDKMVQSVALNVTDAETAFDTFTQNCNAALQE
jgi:multiple sugar transport system substrate-binding protein